MKIKPCPFCGGDAVLQNKAIAISPELIPGYRVACGNELCEISPATRIHSTKEEAIAVWNHRRDIWISVEDTLPEDDDRVAKRKSSYIDYCYVLATTYWDDDEKPFVDKIIRTRTHKTGIYDIDKNVTSFEKWKWGVSAKVTHWQPIPEPPKE